MTEPEERLHVWDFNPLTRTEFVKLMLDVAQDLEFCQHFAGSKEDLGNANRLREIGRRVHYSGEVYREDPKGYYAEHAKPLGIYERTGFPKIEVDVVMKCLEAIGELVGPITDEIDGLLISNRWHKIPYSHLDLASLVATRDSYLFIFDLLKPLRDGLEELEKKRMAR